MKVSDIAVKHVVTVEENDNIAKALARMDENRIHQLPIVSGGSLTGIILLKHLLGREYDPTKSVVKNFLINVPYLNPRMDLDDAIKQIIKSGIRALPVVENGRLAGMLSETDLIKNVEFVSDIQPEKLMSTAITVAENDGIDKAMALMHENNISTLPVINSEEKLAGCIGSLDLIKFLLGTKESPRYSISTAVEKKSLKSFMAKNYMHNAFQLEMDEFSLEKIINALKKFEEVAITKKGRPVGMIVAKDVLELSSLGEQYPIQVSHLRDVDSFEVSKFQDMLARFMEKFRKMFNIQKFFIYAETYKKKEEGHNKFSLRARLLTDKKTYVAKSYAWDLKEATHILLVALEKQLVKNHDRHLGKARRAIKG